MLDGRIPMWEIIHKPLMANINSDHCRVYALLVLQWRHNGRDGVSNHQPHDSLLNRLFGRRSKKTSKFRVTGLCAGNSPVTGEFPAQMTSNAENVPIWWRHHGMIKGSLCKSFTVHCTHYIIISLSYNQTNCVHSSMSPCFLGYNSIQLRRHVRVRWGFLFGTLVFS